MCLLPRSSTTQHRLWRQKTSWRFLVTKFPEAGKKEGNNLIGRRTMPPLGAKPCDTGSNVIGCLATCKAVRRLHISARARESTLTIILFLYNLLYCCLKSFCNHSHQKDKLIYLLFLYHNLCNSPLPYSEP